MAATGAKPAKRVTSKGETVSMYLDRLSAAQSEVSIAAGKLKRLLNSTGRHGDLLVVAGALERAKASVRYLIDAEEA